MNRVIFKVVVGIGSAALLGGGGFLLWRFLKKRREQREEENRPLSVEYIFDREEADQMLKDELQKAEEDAKWNRKKYAEAVETYMDNSEPNENFEEYLAAMENPEEDEDDDEEYYEDEEAEEEEQHPGHDIFRISASEFCNTRTYYDKVSLNYFTGDDVVSDDRDEVVENADTVLGGLQKALQADGAPDLMYIRNEPLEIDYEISRISGSYREEVLKLRKEE